MNGLTRIQKVSRMLRFILMAVMVLLPVVSLVCWLSFNILPTSVDVLNLRSIPIEVQRNLSLHSRLLCFAASFIPICVQMVGIVVLMRLFKLYEQMLFFSDANVACFRKLGKVLLAQAIAGVLYVPLLSLAITMDNPPGQRRLAVGFDSLDVTALVVGIMVIVISWVMEEGRKIQDEHLYTV